MPWLERIGALVRKETTQLLRNRRALAVVFCTPLLALLLLGYAMHMSVTHIPTAVADLSLDSASREFVDALAVSGCFDIKMYLRDEEAVMQAIDAGRVKAGLVIPAGLAAKTERGEGQVLFLFDGSDSLSVQSGYGSAMAIAQAYSMQLVAQKVRRMGGGLEGYLAPPVNTSIRVLYNPDMRDIVFVVPGLAAILMQFLALNLTAMAVVREREAGTMEQLLATPARPLELIIGKMVPNVALTLADTVLIVAVGIVWFDVPFRGSIALFIWLSLLFIISGLALGLLVSTVAQTQRQAQQITAMLLMFAILLTGFIYPREAMPPVVQVIGGLIPLTYFTRIARGIFSKGIGITFLWSDVLSLVVYSVITVTAAVLTFRRRLD